MLGVVGWIPFGMILRGALQAHRAEQSPPVLPLDMALSLYQDSGGRDLLAASREQPQFLVFLRHFGCTFCREALADLAAINDRLRAVGARLVLVHMSEEVEARSLFESHAWATSLRSAIRTACSIAPSRCAAAARPSCSAGRSGSAAGTPA